MHSDTQLADASADIGAAVRVLREGGLVAMPTETVYGLAADATNPAAVLRVFQVKGRPLGHPLIVHVADAGVLGRWAAQVPHAAQRLGAAFWPGPLTIVLQRSHGVPDVVTGGLPTVALRVPDHPLALELLRRLDGGVAAPSANRFGSVSPTTAQHVRDDLGNDVDMVLDGGPCRVGIESTIVDLSGDVPAVLRPGGITAEQLEEVLGAPVPLREGGAVRAPGTLPSHYAPRTPVEAVPHDDAIVRAQQLDMEGRHVGLLVLDPPASVPGSIEVLDQPRDLETLARDLYASLRRADELRLDVLVVGVPPRQGLGAAIADRVGRAAHPRDSTA